MKNLILLLVAFASFSVTNVISAQEKGEVYTVVEEMPQFENGQDDLFKFLVSNIKYPEEAKKAGVEGTVYVSFVINANGDVTNVKVLRGIGYGCDEESIRVVKAMQGHWKPGTQKGKAVNVQYNLPIRYTLGKAKKDVKVK